VDYIVLENADHVQHTKVYSCIFLYFDFPTSIKGIEHCIPDIIIYFNSNDEKESCSFSLYILGGKEDSFILTEAEKTRWSADKEEEQVLMGNHFDPPRIVVSV